MPIPDGITREHVLEAMRQLDAGHNHAFGESTRYDVVFEGSRADGLLDGHWDPVAQAGGLTAYRRPLYDGADEPPE